MDFSSIAEVLQAIAVFFGVVVCAYAGFVLVADQNPETRNEWKEIVAGVMIGLSLIFLSPILASLVSGGTYC